MSGETLGKAKLAQLIVERVDGWSQNFAAAPLGTDQPRLSDLRRGRLDRFSLAQLTRFVARVDGTIEIHVTWRQRKENRLAQRGRRKAPNG